MCKNVHVLLNIKKVSDKRGIEAVQQTNKQQQQKAYLFRPRAAHAKNSLAATHTKKSTKNQ